MIPTKIFVCLIFISLFFNVSTSQEYVLRFQNISTKQGLSDNRITDVLQDSNGFLWAATELAINKYNGENTETYNLSPKGIVNQLIEDDKGHIWAATTKGLFFFNPNRNTFELIHFEKNKFTNAFSRHIIKMISTKNGYWIITDSSLVGFKMSTDFNIIENSIKIIKTPPALIFTSIIEGDDGTLWLGSNSGKIFYYHSEAISSYTPLAYNNTTSINDLVIDTNNTLWVATNGNGLFSINQKNNKTTHFKSQTPKGINNNIVLCLYLDTNSNIWIGTDGGGLNLFQKQHNSFYYFQQSYNSNHSISDNSILSIKPGLDNTILLSTVHGGICIFKNQLEIKRISSQQLGFNTKDGQSSTILEDSNKTIWLSAGRNGLRHYNPKTKNVKVFIDDTENQSDLNGNIVLSLMEDNQQRIWIGTLRGGLNIYDVKKETFLFAEEGRNLRGIFAIKESKDNTIWVGCRDGVKVYDNALNIIEHIQVGTRYTPGNNVTAIYKDIKGDMWVGTGHGLHKFHPAHNTLEKTSYFLNQNDSTSLSSNHILSIAETNDLSLLIGTYGYGVNKYSRSKNTFERLECNQQIEGSIIRGILKDNNQNIWLSTNTGLSKINFDGSIINLSPNEGIQAFNGGAAALNSDGSIIMAGNQGLTYFNPQELKHDSPQPKVFFTSASNITKEQDSRPVNTSFQINKATQDSPINIPHNTVLFSINFSSSYFYESEGLKYAYKLEGLNDTWQAIENTKSLSFSSLKPGNYKLNVRVANELGVWSPHTASLKLKVIPSFWERNSTKTVLFVSLVALIIFIFRWRLSAVKHQKEKLQRLLKIKTDEAKKQQDEVYQGKIALLNFEKKNQELNQKKLRGELNFKINELTNNTLRTVHKNNLLNDIKEKLKKETQQKQIDKQNLRNIISLIDDSFIMDKDWKNFYSLFNQVHPTFIKDLKKYCSKLSERDIQLCALIKLNFSSQHIATLYGISLSSVKVARHRLRKKLNIEGQQSLKDFLFEIDAA
ncbi:hypothetical protein NO995_13585 [Aestuariibaculum sp. M13]|uniref:ligand-binding sensor domain-containing protein n=1 Tax=Aestuariibaculum sp. M13 TaxID=2967132 RepID=UPI002159D28B|nr:two-component regulator propeller domain-containing protein [Aestuariibaculum sp. M13]MCR8668719.1 hypothetical protein [Aestuariibaculum sp. M13]